MANRLLTPPLAVRWAYIKEPNYKWKDEGEFSCELMLDPEDEEHQAFIDTLGGLVEASYENAMEANPKARKTMVSKIPVHIDYDEEGEETGLSYIKCKLTHEVFSKKKNKTYKFYVDVFDASSPKPLKRDDIPQVGNGSIVAVALETRDYYSAQDKEAGITLDLKAMQLIDVRDGQASDATSYGFGQQEGYTAPKENTFEGGKPDEDEDDF